MATRVDLGQISLTQLNCPTLITPSLLQHSWFYVLYQLSYGSFCVNFFLHFRYHGNRGLSDVYFNDTVKLLDLENPLFNGATSLAPSLVLAEF